MKKKKLPKECRLDPESGDILCEEGAPTKLEPVPTKSDDTLGNIFKHTGIQVESAHCKTDKRDGKFKCKFETTSDQRPSDSSS